MYDNIEICDCDLVHEDTVKKVEARMPGEDILCDMAELFKVFGDSTRIRILSNRNCAFAISPVF